MNPDTLWAMLRTDLPSEHLFPMQHLVYAQTPYPADDNAAPWKRQKGSGESRKLAVARILYNGDTPLALEIYGPQYRNCHILSVGSGTDSLTDILLNPSLRGSIIAFPQGADREFHTLLRYYAQGMVKDGVTLSPIASGCEVRAIHFKRGKASWWAVDFNGCTGFNEPQYTEWGSDIQRGYDLFAAYQRFIERELGGSLSITVGGTAIRTAARYLPEGDWLWRANPFTVALCREGMAYRGGYLYAQRYKGAAYKYDQNRAYLSALSTGLPLRRAIGRCLDENNNEREGVFLCTVRGPGLHPVYLSPWDKHSKQFQPARNWNGPSCVCVLPSSEFAGLRRLGYTVEPSYGVIHWEQTNINGYVERLTNIMLKYPRGTWQNDAAKPLGNAVYGKFGEGLVRNNLRFAESEPKDFLPFVTPEGECISYLWTKQEYVSRPHQQIDAAAMITGVVRSRTYSAMAHALEMGYGVVMADTDSITTKKPMQGWTLDDRRVGGWRLEAKDTEAVIAGEKRYKVGNIVRDVGSGTRNPKDIELVYDGTYTVGKKRAVRQWR